MTTEPSAPSAAPGPPPPTLAVSNTPRLGSVHSTLREVRASSCRPGQARTRDAAPRAPAARPFLTEPPTCQPPRAWEGSVEAPFPYWALSFLTVSLEGDSSVKTSVAMCRFRTALSRAARLRPSGSNAGAQRCCQVRKEARRAAF